MPENKSVLVFDFGASGGRAMLCTLSGDRLVLDEIHRFSNDPVIVRGGFYWDVLRLFHEIKQGIIKAAAKGSFDSIGIDTWGVDFGIIDSDGFLADNPYNYRDTSTAKMPEKVFEKISSRELYSITGNQIMDINTLFRLEAIRIYRSRIYELPHSKMLLMPDLFGYLLTGERYAEMSIASTTQMLDIHSGQWAFDMLKRLELRCDILPDIIKSGTKVGRLSEELCTELNVSPCDVTAVCGHDTQCAAAAVPASEEDYIFISCGTWSLFGTETDKPIVSELSAEYNITNEIGFGGRITFLKNIIGLWFIQETRRYLRKCGEELSFGDIESLAREAEPFRCFIDPDAPEFVPPGNIPERVREYCRRTGQYVPRSTGEVMRCIYESLAMKYRQTMTEISQCTGKSYSKIYMVGGGIKDTFLCSLAASACGCTVCAGPVEATAYGNAAIQLISQGAISDISEARRIIAQSEEIKEYIPENSAQWQTAYEKYISILGK